MPSLIHRNHLIVGLGGTGGNIIRALRKSVTRTIGRRIRLRSISGSFTSTPAGS